MEEDKEGSWEETDVGLRLGKAGSPAISFSGRLHIWYICEWEEVNKRQQKEGSIEIESWARLAEGLLTN